MNVKTNVVFRTDDYSFFKELPGNRDILDGRIAKIEKSIKENGYIFNPIIINNRREIIDGQGRKKALERLGLPIDYIIVDGLGVKDCIALNVYQTKWNTMDYINSFADMGNVSYSYLRHLCKKFPDISIRVCVAAISDKSIGFEISGKRIQTGDFSCTAEQYEASIGILEYIHEFIPFIDISKGRKELIFSALIFAYKVESVDNDRLLDRFKKYYSMEIVKPFNSIEGAMVAINTVYNYRSTIERLHLEIEYENAQRSKFNYVVKGKNRKAPHYER